MVSGMYSLENRVCFCVAVEILQVLLRQDWVLLGWHRVYNPSSDNTVIQFILD